MMKGTGRCLFENLNFMRLHLRTSDNSEPVPFNYQRSLVGAFHKWVGENEIHDSLSLYSLGWLHGGKANGKGLNFRAGAQWQISSPDQDLLKTLVSGIQNKPEIAYGMRAREVLLQHEPEFSSEQRFLVESPVLVKRTLDDNRVKYYLYNDQESDRLMTETLKNKLAKAGKANLDIAVSFDRNHHNPRTKLINYNGIKIKANLCPVILKGDPEAIAFAWNVGVGNSTGIGFGALK